MFALINLCQRQRPTPSRRLALVVAALILPLNVALAQSDADYAAMAAAVARGPMLASYQQHAQASADLLEMVAAVCDQPKGSAVTADAGAASEALAAAHDSFAALSALHYGPIIDGFGPARIRFWPDSRNTGERQLRGLLATEDPEALAPERIAEGSVAVADLVTVRRLMHDNPAEPGRFSCRYALAVAGHQRALAQDLAQQAEAFVAVAAFPGPDNPAYPAGQDAARDVYKSLIATTDYVIARLLDPVLGDGPQSIRAGALEAWETGQSAAMIAARLRMLERILTEDGGFLTVMEQAGLGALGQGLAQEYAALADAFDDLPPNLDEALATDDGWAWLDTLRQRLKDQRLLLGTTVAREMGLSQGFNASDGD